MFHINECTLLNFFSFQAKGASEIWHLKNYSEAVRIPREHERQKSKMFSISLRDSLHTQNMTTIQKVLGYFNQNSSRTEWHFGWCFHAGIWFPIHTQKTRIAYSVETWQEQTEAKIASFHSTLLLRLPAFRLLGRLVRLCLSGYITVFPSFKQKYNATKMSVNKAFVSWNAVNQQINLR